MKFAQALAVAVVTLSSLGAARAPAQPTAHDPIYQLQQEAMDKGSADWGHWGIRPAEFAGCQQHSNRLVPAYVFGGSLASHTGPKSPYRDPEAIHRLYGRIPSGTLNAHADYFDQTQLYEFQRAMIDAGKKYVFLVIFDGMDWQTVWAAAIARSGAVPYTEGRGTGLRFLDYRAPVNDYAHCVTSPYSDRATLNVDAQTALLTDDRSGGYDPELGGFLPWQGRSVAEYLLGDLRACPHVVTDSASSATSICSGIKTYNAAINVTISGSQVVPLARQLQAEHGCRVGVVTSVPISHATPAAAYANNVSRDDYQDLTRDLLGLPSVAHRDPPLSGVDVLIGAGWGCDKDQDEPQGANYVPGNRYLAEDDLRQCDVRNGGRYQVALRTPGSSGADLLREAAAAAAVGRQRLLGYFGTTAAHLPYQTADGKYDPPRGFRAAEAYTPADLHENPTLAEMTRAALVALETSERGFWLMVEAGDVDWANHDDNLDNAIGAVFSGDEAFAAITEWIEQRDAWTESLVIVTADHGHLLQLVQPDRLAQAAREIAAPNATGRLDHSQSSSTER